MKKAKPEKKKQETPAPEPKAAKRSAKAVLRFVRIAPRKVRIVINAIRFEPPFRAFNILLTFKKKAARMTEKLLKSAVANAKVLGLDEERLYISDVRADGGPTFKRFMSRSMGRADRILKRTTHLSITVSEGDRKFGGAPAAAPEQEEVKEAPKAGKKLFSRKKKSAAAGSKA